MVDQHLNEGPSTSNVSGENSDSIVEINIKTLESQIFSFQVDKNMPVSSFKEKIANDIGIPVGQQRLIFRGKVLKDDHLLSEYHVENGHTLHLVVRQPTQSQPSSDMTSGESNGNNGNQGNGNNAGAPRNRVGQISHSVLLGTFNVGDQGEGIAPELSRVIGAVVNSLGIGGQTTTNGIQFSSLANTLGQPPQGNETYGTLRSVGSQNQDGSQTGQAFPGQPFSLSSQAVQIPLAAAAVPIPSLHAPIPDSLYTLSEFINRMEQALSQNGYQPNSSSTSNEDVPQVELPSTGQGLPTPEALGIVLQHAQRLLGGHAVAALSHIAGRLEQEGASSDHSIRGQIQAETAQVGLAMQHLGSLLLELGRVILTLRMGQSPGEASVNAGPAVYISPSGPNPIMVQPFPLQTSSLFGASAPSSNPMSLGPVGIGNAPRHINIHIHAGTALAPVVSTVGTSVSNGDGVQGERGNSTGSADSAGSVRVVPVRNVIAAAVPSRAAPGLAISTAAQPGRGFSVSTQPANSVLLSSVMNEVNSQIRNLVGTMQGGNQVVAGEVESNLRNLSAGNNAGNVGNELPHSITVSRVGEPSVSQPGVMAESEDQKALAECHQVRNNEDMGSTSSSKDASTCSVESSQSFLNGEPAVKLEGTSENTLGLSEKQCDPEGAKPIPLGLGLGGLERKRRTRQPKAPVKSGDGGTSSSAPLDQNLDARSLGQHLLRSLAPSSVTNKTDANENKTDANEPPSGQLLLAGTATESRQSGGQNNDEQLDTASAMSQALRSSEINGLLSGFSEQTGVGSPDVLRNMLLQLTQSPQIMNTVNQIAQQIDGQDLGNMFSGLGGGQGGGIDLSRMVQQMMPVVSQALTRGSAAPQHNERRSSGGDNFDEQNFEIGVRQVAQMIEHSDPPEEIFRAIVENAGRLHSNGSPGPGDLMDDLCNDEVLAHEYAEMLRYDIRLRLQGDSGRDKC